MMRFSISIPKPDVEAIERMLAEQFGGKADAEFTREFIRAMAAKYLAELGRRAREREDARASDPMCGKCDKCSKLLSSMSGMFDKRNMN